MNNMLDGGNNSRDGLDGEKCNDCELYWFDKRELLSPIVIGIALIVYCLASGDWLGFVGLPLIYLGRLCCAPNMNLADGCFAVLATGVVGILGLTMSLRGLIIAAAACCVTWFVASFESSLRCKPVVCGAETDSEDKDTKGPDQD